MHLSEMTDERIRVPDVGGEMHALLARLYPICRSLSGDGVRQTLRILQDFIPLDVREVATGTQVFDWTVPQEWNIRDAWIKNSRGELIVSFRTSNLHVLGYSLPVHRRMSLKELRPHLYSDPGQPDRIPYRTSYYAPNWGFCLRHDQLSELADDEYEVYIDATLSDGSMTYGECVLPGATTDEVLIACHTCHPSLCNDSLSGVVLATFLARAIAASDHRYTYRFLFTPGTIGPIAWLSLNEPVVHRVKHGLVVTCVGDPGSFTYKKTRRGDAEIDRAVIASLTGSGRPFKVLDFSPYGGDERQFCSPGFDLAVGALMRTPYGEFPEYHTSSDDLNFVRGDALAESLDQYLSVVDTLERNRRCMNTNPKCEPQLGRRGLYGAIGGSMDDRRGELAMLWVLNLSDGQHDLLDIAERAKLPFRTIATAAEVLRRHGLLADGSLPGVQAAFSTKQVTT
jgi:aminopeptidase-like protein